MSGSALDAAVAERLERCARDRVVERIWARDLAVWGGDASTPELGDRLGWLDLPTTMAPSVPALVDFADEVRTGFDRVVRLQARDSIPPSRRTRRARSRPARQQHRLTIPGRYRPGSRRSVGETTWR